ncbi:hypothetical protein ACFPK9_09295 [Rubritalea spongiae]|uniref:Uncharacterized protein n=1 Tax=Rubritalea spongiae TaxID=430797 RepID=A0ABW5E4Q6_9BACT
MEADSIYKSPSNVARDLATLSDSELRSYYAQDEVCVLAVGWFYLFFGSLLFSVSSFGFVVSYLLQSLALGFISFCFFMVSFAYILLGWGMRYFDPWSRLPARFAALVMMFIFPVGTPTGLICYYLLKTRSHEDVFSVKYRSLLLVDPSQDKYHATWIPIITGTISGLTLPAFFYLFHETLIQLLNNWI